jgi:hypothetical protein
MDAYNLYSITFSKRAAKVKTKNELKQKIISIFYINLVLFHFDPICAT